MAKKKTGTIESYTLKNGEKRYKFQIYIGTDPLTGKEQRTTRSKFKTKKEAELALARLKLDIANGQYKKIQAETYFEVYELWVKDYENRVEESTYVKTLGIFRNHILPAMGAYKIDKINITICQRHVNEWVEKLVNGDKTKSYASLVMRFAVKHGYINSNPFDLVDLPRNRKKKTANKENFYTREQLTHFLACAEQEPNFKTYAFFSVLAHSGMRKGEALALTWDDIDFKKEEISITKAVGQGKSQRLYIKSTKTGSERIISMDGDTMTILKKWKIKQNQIYLTLGYNTLNKDQLVFSNSKNNLIQPTKTNDWLKAILKKYNLAPISTHGFRHTHCSIQLEAGVLPKDVQTRLGHTDMKTTMDTYAHITNESRVKAVKTYKTYLNQTIL